MGRRPLRCARAALAAALIALLAAAPQASRLARSRDAVAEFKLTHPCPANGRRAGPCPGYVVDHVEPLACGGRDAPSNMQWQTVAEAREKDRTERIDCWKVRRPGGP